jgi:hypothetical protein
MLFVVVPMEFRPCCCVPVFVVYGDSEASNCRQLIKLLQCILVIGKVHRGCLIVVSFVDMAVVVDHLPLLHANNTTGEKRNKKFH